MASLSSFWGKKWFRSFFQSSKPTHTQKKHWRGPAPRRLRLEQLEGRTLLTTVTGATVASLPADATSLTILGTGFDPLVANDIVTLKIGHNNATTLVSPTNLTVVSATPTSITVTFANTTLLAGSVKAVVSADSVSSGAAVAVTNVTPVITSCVDSSAVNATTLTIKGYGFDTTGSPAVAFSTDGGSGTASVTDPQTLSVTSFTATTAGALTATVTFNGQSNASPVQVATLTPVVTAATANNVNANAASFTIAGFGFDTTSANDTVTLNDGAVGHVIGSPTATSLTVQFDTYATTAGELDAVVTVGTVSSGQAVQVATIKPVLTAVTSPNNPQAVNQTTMSFTGYGFDPTVGNDLITFTDGSQTLSNIAVTTFTAAAGPLSPETVTVTFTTPPANSGVLNAVAKVNCTVAGSGVTLSSSTTQVASLTPVVTSSTLSIAGGTTTILINGYGFDTTGSNDTVTLSDGSGLTVTANSSNQLSVALTTGPTVVGPLTASVAIGALSSGAAVQVATITPTVAANAGSKLSADPAVTTQVLIVGTGFSTTASKDTVTFDNGATGHIDTITPPTATLIIVDIDNPPTTAGALNAVVGVKPTGGTSFISSGTSIQVATIVPTVDVSVASLDANATTMTITGHGFDSTTLANNVVTFTGGATGHVTAATPTSLTVTFDTDPPLAGPLTASVSVGPSGNRVSSGAAVQVGTVLPVVLSSTADLAANTGTLTITGYGFNSAPFTSNTVTLSGGAVGVVSAFSAGTPETLTLTLTTLPTGGTLNVTGFSTNGKAMAPAELPVQVATVKPVVSGNASYQPGASAGTLYINGYGFDTTAPLTSHDTISFSNGATGTVTAATANLLTVTMGTAPTAGAMTAVVTVNGASSAAATAATVTPTITLATGLFSAGSTTLVIQGSGFDPTAGSDSVSFDGGTSWITPTAASAGQLTLTFTAANSPSTTGNLMAIVKCDGISSAQTQVATVGPTVTTNTASVAENAGFVTITGLGFDTTAGNNTVVFNDGAVGVVTGTPTATSLTVTLSTLPTSLGSMTAVVTTNGQSSGAPVQVATITPALTASTSTLAAGATSQLIIKGYGFSTTPGNNTITFSNGATGTVAASPTPTATQLTVNVSGAAAGNLTASITVGGQTSSTVQVATVAPTVTSSNNTLAANATAITINGYGFDPNGTNSVSFTNGTTTWAGIVTAVTANWLTATISGNPSVIAAGPLNAIVTTNGVASGTTGVQVALLTPIVTSSTATQAANVGTFVINGFGFSTTAASHNTVVLSNGAVGVITSTPTTTAMTVTVLTNPTTVGSMTATVTCNGQAGTATQVATVAPVVLANTSYTISSGAASITINGAGFDTNKANDVLTLNDGAVGTITGTPTATSLTYTFATGFVPTAGNITASISVNGISSGQPVQIAKVTSVVTPSTATLAANATTTTIAGSGFDPGGTNTVSFTNNGTSWAGTVTAVTPTSLTVGFGTGHLIVGALTATVTVDGTAAAPVQVNTVIPVVTGTYTAQDAQTATVVITGAGFDPTAANDSILFSNGATVSGNPVVNASGTSMTVTFGTKPIAGNLTAVVTADGQNSGAAVQVARVTPVVQNITTAVAANSTTMTISGYGFDPTASNNLVALNYNGGTGTATGVVTSFAAGSPEHLTVTFSAPPTAGNLYAIVTTNGVAAANQQVATITPVVTGATSAQNSGVAINATTISISGCGFDPSAASKNTVVFTDGAIGTVQSATSTLLTVLLSGQGLSAPTAVGAMNVTVTTNLKTGNTYAASVVPAITSGIINGATSIVIKGAGFSTTPGNNTVVFNNGAIGTVAASPVPTAGQLTVTFSTPPTAGILTANITVGGKTSSTVQVATVAPVVTASTTALAATANTLYIRGTYFDSTPGNNIVSFNDGAVGTVIGASSTMLQVQLTTAPASAGSLTATVTTNGVSNGSAVQVATVTPVVTTSSTKLDNGNCTTLIINGFGFDPTATKNLVTFDNGAVGTVQSATPTALTVTFAGGTNRKPTAAGSLNAAVTVNSQSSGTPVQVAQVSAATGSTPTLTAISQGAPNNVPANLASLTSPNNRFTIGGTNFDTTAANDLVILSNGAVGTVQSATGTLLTVTLTTNPLTSGVLTAVVIVNGVSTNGGTPVNVATIQPVVTSSTASLGINATTLTINGFGFDPTASKNTVAFSTLGVVGTVTAATRTSLTVSLSGGTNRGPNGLGSLNAIVTSDSVAGASAQVANVVPVVTAVTTNPVSFNTSNTVTITGYGFTGAVAGGVSLNNGATVASIVVNSTNSITVTFGTKPTALGVLNATVTVGGNTSNTAQVGTVVPTVTATSPSLSAAATTFTITGKGFDPTPANNTVVLSNGAAGVVVGATTTSLLVQFTTLPMAGNLTAMVTTNGLSSGTAVQVATVVPVVTGSSTSVLLSSNPFVVTINGFGFDPTAANDTVTLSSGTVKTIVATANSLVVTFATLPTAGPVTATVNTKGQSSNTIQICKAT